MRIVRTLSSVIISIMFVSSAFAIDIKTELDPEKISKSRKTPFGLYLTPKEAFEAISANPNIVMIDVRDPIQISFVGHPKTMDGNIPLRTVSRKFNTKSGKYEMTANPNFVIEVDALMKRLGYSKNDPVFVTCRSGPRSAVAARLLHKAGYNNVWNLVEGFEGSIDPKSGARSKNGWRNSELPWSYKISATAAWQPSSE